MTIRDKIVYVLNKFSSGPSQENEGRKKTLLSLLHWKFINRVALRTTCQIVFYLAWRLTDPVAEAKLFVFGTSNLPPSKEGGEVAFFVSRETGRSGAGQICRQIKDDLSSALEQKKECGRPIFKWLLMIYYWLFGFRLYSISVGGQLERRTVSGRNKILEWLKCHFYLERSILIVYLFSKLTSERDIFDLFNMWLSLFSFDGFRAMMAKT